MRLSHRRQLLVLLAFAFLARLLTLGCYPLTDTTEARYGEIARKMVETGQWLVPQIDYGVPFWGKPPLSFWLTAISFKLLGVSEFAARIPSLLLAVATCGLAYLLGSRRGGSEHGLRAATVVATSILMMVAAGGVMTDPAMVLGTTLSMVAFWLALTGARRSWGYLFFIGLAVGLLAKGPVALVLTVLPIGVWTAVTGRTREVWRALPWLRGALLTAVLVIPWYWAAEVRNPGFLQYFLIGEHWQRFTVSGWKGDLYGSGHAYPTGTIWLFALMGTLPWSPWLLWQVMRRRGAGAAPAPQTSNDGWLLYLLCWMLAPLVFFTLARNILPTYALPGLIGFGLLVAEAWQRQPPRPQALSWGLALASPIFATAFVLVIWPRAGFQSQSEIVSAYRSARPGDLSLAYFRQRPYSAEFYTHGRSKEIGSVPQLRLYLVQHEFVATRRSDLEHMPIDLRAGFDMVMTSHTGDYVLLRQRPSALLVRAPDARPRPILVQPTMGAGAAQMTR